MLKRHHQTITACFRKMDKNCDNQVSLEELKHGFEVEAHVVLSMPDSRALFAAFDRNGDGTVDLGEMLDVFVKLQREQKKGIH